jgi:hypothetical protein
MQKWAEVCTDVWAQRRITVRTPDPHRDFTFFPSSPYWERVAGKN